MATRLTFRRFSSTSIANLVGANGELYVDTTKKTLVVQDGSTTGGSTLATETYVTTALAGVSFSTSVLSGYALSSTLTSYTTNANLTSTLNQYTLSSALTSYTTNVNLTSTLVQYALSSVLTSYTTNANLTSTLTNYTTNANLTSTLTNYTTNANLTSTLAAYSFNTSVLTSYTTNANLTSTLNQYTLSSALTSYTTNANLTSTLASYTTNANLTSTLANYTTNANLTSTLASYTTNANLTSTLATYVPTTSLLTVTTLTANTITVTNSSNATTTANGAVILYGGLSVNRDIFLAGTSTLKIGSGKMSITQNSITASNDTLTLRAGGSGSNIGSMYFTNGSGVQIWGGSATASQPAFSGYGIKLANRDGNVSVSDSSDSTSISTGSFVVTGGVGISKRLNVGGQALVSSLSVSNNAIISGQALVSSLSVSNNAILGPVYEEFQTKTSSTGTVTHDCSLGHIFYHTSSVANWTANFTNLSLSSGYATTFTLVINQGVTGYYPSAVQIGGVAQTILWQGNTTPTPSSSRTDVVTFSILNNSDTYTVLGQLTGF
jgi:hypothetical protein